jgi:hypothetical protein
MTQIRQFRVDPNVTISLPEGAEILAFLPAVRGGDPSGYLHIRGDFKAEKWEDRDFTAYPLHHMITTDKPMTPLGHVRTPDRVVWHFFELKL